MKNIIDILGTIVTIGAVVLAAFIPAHSETFIAAAFATGFGTKMLDYKTKVKELLAEIGDQSSLISNKNLEISKLTKTIEDTKLQKDETKVTEEPVKATTAKKKKAK